MPRVSHGQRLGGARGEALAPGDRQRATWPGSGPGLRRAQVPLCPTWQWFRLKTAWRHVHKKGAVVFQR